MEYQLTDDITISAGLTGPISEQVSVCLSDRMLMMSQLHLPTRCSNTKTLTSLRLLVRVYEAPVSPAGRLRVEPPQEAGRVLPQVAVGELGGRRGGAVLQLHL